MGEWFETIADVKATPEEAERRGAEVLCCLVEQGIVMADPDGCTLRIQGHRPGPDFASATVEQWPDLHRLATNGVCVVTGRTVFYSMGPNQCGLLAENARSIQRIRRLSHSFRARSRYRETTVDRHLVPRNPWRSGERGP